MTSLRNACLALALAISTTVSAGTYVGERNSNARFHGQGTYTYLDGSTYVGEWIDGKKQGRGTRAWADGTTYEGEWHNNQPHGQGEKIFPNGDRYTGQFYVGEAKGKGTYTWTNGDVYEGEFDNNVPDGKGSKTYANGEEFAGDFATGKRTGSGIYTYADGTQYVGEWQNDLPHGMGTLSFADGSIYEGDFSDGERTGSGVFTYANGDVYTGKWNAGQRSGEGKYSYAEGGHYTGEFRKDRRSGFGVEIASNGYRYEGNFENNLRHGQGTCFDKNDSSPCSYKKGKLIGGYDLINTFPGNNAEQLAAAAENEMKAIEEDDNDALIALAATAGATAAAIKNQHGSSPGAAALSVSAASAIGSGSDEATTEIEPGTAKPQPADPVDAATIASISNEASINLSDLEQPNVTSNKPTTVAELTEPAPAPTLVIEEDYAPLPEGMSRLVHQDVANDGNIYYEHDLYAKDLKIQDNGAFWQKQRALFSQDLRINAESGKIGLSMLIQNYKGPGTYELDRAKVRAFIDGIEQAKSTSKLPGRIIITKDDDNVIQGRFEVTVFQEGDPNASSFTIKNGEFTLAEKAESFY